MSKKVQKFLANRAASTKEGSIPVPFPPPLALEKLFSRSGWRRIFPLYSRVMQGGPSTAHAGKSAKSLSLGQCSLKLMTAPFWCSGCKALFWNEFMKAND
jgi:hypothetical protein